MQYKKRISKPLPSLKHLRESFAYDPEIGILMWRDRPRSHFSSDTAHKRTNNLTAGTIAGSPYLSGKTHKGISANVSINCEEYAIPRIIYKLMTGKDPERNVFVRDCKWPYLPFKNIVLADK